MSDNFEEQLNTFPEETSEIMFKILENFGLKESPTEIQEKFQSNKEPNFIIVATILRETVDKNLSFSDFSSLLQNQLQLSGEKAGELATDLKKEILSLARKPKEITVEETEKSEEPKSQDIYREPLE